MALWTCFAEVPGDQCIRTVSFVDDRLMWSSNPAGAAVAKERSDLFDQAFFLSCDAAKSRVASQVTRYDEGKLLVSEFGYACNTFFLAHAPWLGWHQLPSAAELQVRRQ